MNTSGKRVMLCYLYLMITNRNIYILLIYIKSMNKATSITKIGKEEIVEANTDFYNGLLALKQAKSYLITPRDEAKIRIATASDKHIGKEYGTWTTAGFEYAKNSPVLLRLNSHLMDYQLAKQAVEANSQGRYFFSESKFYEESAKQAEHDKNESPEKRKVLILPSKTNFKITSQNNMEVLEFLLRSKQFAKEYYNFNGSKPITTYLVEPKYVDAQDGTLMTQLWLYRLDAGSVLDGDWNLHNCNWVRGVR